MRRFSARTLGLLASLYHYPSRMMPRATATCSTEERDEEQEDDEELRDGGVPFYVNRGGLPVDEETWERMWRHVARIHPQGEAVGRGIRGATDLPKVCPPVPN